MYNNHSNLELAYNVYTDADYQSVGTLEEVFELLLSIYDGEDTQILEVKLVDGNVVEEKDIFEYQSDIHTHAFVNVDIFAITDTKLLNDLCEKHDIYVELD